MAAMKVNLPKQESEVRRATKKTLTAQRPPLQTITQAHHPIQIVTSQIATGNLPQTSPQKKSQRYPELLALFDEDPFEQHFQPDSTIFLHGEPADAFYLIASGTVRCCTIGAEGSRQIFRFATKGDYFGISDLSWHWTAEAVDHVILRKVSRPKIEKHLADSEAFRREMRALVCAQLEMQEQQLLALVSQKAPERLFHFLCDFAATRSGSDIIALPMCRRDIADHLGLSVETVSRAFGELKREGWIELETAEKFKINADMIRPAAY
jgi:CRP-like cAMP-binding protein